MTRTGLRGWERSAPGLSAQRPSCLRLSGCRACVVQVSGRPGTGLPRSAAAVSRAARWRTLHLWEGRSRRAACAPHGRSACFRFTITAAGDTLTIRCSDRSASRTGRRSSARTGARRRRRRRARPPGPGPARCPSRRSRRAGRDSGKPVLPGAGQLAQGLPGPRRLRDCHGSDGWPQRGVYFFFEPGEVRADGSDRVVRVGTHALTATSQATLWGRLRQHRGRLAGLHPGGGNHRASVFRAGMSEPPSSAVTSCPASCSAPGWTGTGRPPAGRRPKPGSNRPSAPASEPCPSCGSASRTGPTAASSSATASP